MTTSMISSARSLRTFSITGGGGFTDRRAGSVYGGGFTDRRAGSVYGGAGGHGVRISSGRTFHDQFPRPIQRRFPPNPFISPYYDPFRQNSPNTWHEPPMGNGKANLQALNQRLAIYLNEVLALEKANCEMELKIHQFMESRVGPSSRDYTAYYPTIADLKAKILDAKRINAEVRLSAHNAALASDDFKAKYEHELNMRVAVEADIGELRQYLDEITLERSQQESDLEVLNRELISLNMNHQEELKKSRPDMTEPDCICPKPAPSDLLNTMGEIRDHYEAIVAKNLRDLEIWYNAKIEGINNQVSTDKFSLENYRWEVNETKRTLQTIEIELKSMLDLKAAEEETLIEIEDHHHQKLSAHQYQVSSLEHQICHLRADMECQMREYHILLDIKDRLEIEIAEYRRLIDGKNVGGVSCVATPSLSSSSFTTSRKRVVTVVQGVVDGRVVSSSTETTSDPLTSS